MANTILLFFSLITVFFSDFKIAGNYNRETKQIDFVEDGYIAFEVSKSKSHTLSFRKVYTNPPDKTIAKGIL